MTKFDYAVDIVLRHEGGYTYDHAGPTNYGITLSALGEDIDGDGIIDGDDILAITIDDAKRIYKQKFWRYEEISNWQIAGKVFDLAVNMGSVQAHKILQSALRSCGAVVIVDGIIGPITLKAVNTSDSEALLAAIRSEAACFYKQLAAKKPSYQKYLKGWLNRAYD